jgi:ornithine carbamoyltransferase
MYSSHPCQIMADVMTFEQHRGPIRDRTLAWVGDGNNVASSWVHAAQRFDFQLRIACPPELAPAPEVLAWAAERQARVQVVEDPHAAVAGAAAVLTDVWVSMGQEERRATKLEDFDGFQVNADLVDDQYVMHCLPAHRGEEITDAVLESGSSIVWDQAENRLHAQKGLLAYLRGV